MARPLTSARLAASDALRRAAVRARDLSEPLMDRAGQITAPLSHRMQPLTQRVHDRWQWLQTRLPFLASPPDDPAARLFRAIQLRLILWFMGVLAVILILAGALLYDGMTSQLLGQVNANLATNAQGVGQSWLLSGEAPCTDPHLVVQAPYVACFDSSLNLIGGSVITTSNLRTNVVNAFTEPTVARLAIQNGSAIDTVNGGSGLGAIRRYALAVRAPDGALVGVVQVGIPIQGELDSLRTLLTLLLIGGLLTLVGAAIGGVLLADRALAPARQAMVRQDRFIADASHEIRTPLTLMQNDADLLLRNQDRLIPEDRDLVEDIRTEARNMTTLMRNMLLLVRLDAGAVLMRHDLVDLSDVAASIVHRARVTAEERGLTLTYAPSGPALCQGDQDLIEQAAMILLDNALKYTRAGGLVTIAVQRQHNVVALEVRDTGIGISQEDQDKVGQRFFRSNKARTRDLGGVGLGLSIATRIVRLHQGRLAIASEVNVGSTFGLVLPAIRFG